jgi:hypothetical protein
MKTTPRFLLASFALSLFAIGCDPQHPSVGPGGHDPTAPKPAGVMPAPMPPPPDTMTPMNPPVEQGVSLLVQGHTRTSQIGDSYTVGSATVAEFYALMSGEAATNWKIQLLWICGGNQTEIFSGSPHPITSDLGLQILSSPGSADYLPFTPHGSDTNPGPRQNSPRSARLPCTSMTSTRSMTGTRTYKPSPSTLPVTAPQRSKTPRSPAPTVPKGQAMERMMSNTNKPTAAMPIKRGFFIWGKP